MIRDIWELLHELVDAILQYVESNILNNGLILGIKTLGVLSLWYLIKMVWLAL